MKHHKQNEFKIKRLIFNHQNKYYCILNSSEYYMFINNEYKISFSNNIYYANNFIIKQSNIDLNILVDQTIYCSGIISENTNQIIIYSIGLLENKNLHKGKYDLNICKNINSEYGFEYTQLEKFNHYKNINHEFYFTL